MGKVDTEEMDCGSELRQILVSRETGEVNLNGRFARLSVSGYNSLPPLQAPPVDGVSFGTNSAILRVFIQDARVRFEPGRACVDGLPDSHACRVPPCIDTDG